MSRVGIVDGSNLALQRPPRADRLLQLRDDLESNDFQEVRIICDASLRWKIKDDEQHELLEAKIKSGDVQQVPAKTRADEFILSSALDWKEEGWEVFIITNDLYKEFQEDERFSWLWREDRFIRFFISRLSDDKERVHLKLEGQIERLKPASEAARLSKPAEVLSVTRYDGRYTCNKKGEVWVPVPYDMEKRTLDTPILKEIAACLLAAKPRGGRFLVIGGEVWYWPERYSRDHLGTIKMNPEGSAFLEVTGTE